MKKYFKLLITALAVSILAACGPIKAEKEAKEKASVDSIATNQADSIKAVMEGKQQIILDSLAMAAKAREDSLAHAQAVTDSIDKANGTKISVKRK